MRDVGYEKQPRSLAPHATVGPQSWKAHNQQPTPLRTDALSLLCTLLGWHTLVSVSPPPGPIELARADPAPCPKPPKFPRNTSGPLRGGRAGCPQTQDPSHRQGPPHPARPGRACSQRAGQPSQPTRPRCSRPCGVAKGEEAQRPQVCSGTTLASMTFQGKRGGGL